MAEAKNNITTKSGFSCKINKDVLDDWDLLVSFREIDKGDISAIVDVAPVFLGEAQYQKLREHVKDAKTGKVKASTMVAEVSEIVNLVKELKNS